MVPSFIHSESRAAIRFAFYQLPHGVHGPSLYINRKLSISHGSKSDVSLLKSMSLQVAVAGIHGPSEYTDKNASMSCGSKSEVSLLKSIESHSLHSSGTPQKARYAEGWALARVNPPQIARLPVGSGTMRLT